MGAAAMVVLMCAAQAPAAHALVFANGYSNELSCPAAAQCTAIDVDGTQATFNPTRAGAPIESRVIVTQSSNGEQLGLACASTRYCVAATPGGEVAVFAPARRAAALASLTVGGAAYQTAVSCPSARFCVVESYQGEISFDPAHPGSPVSASFSANANGGQPTIACPSSAQCSGTNGTSGFEYTYNPLAPAGASTVVFAATQAMSAIVCPTRTQCTALASPGSQGVGLGVLSFNPRSPGQPRVKTITQSTLEILACPSTRLCVAGGNNEGVLVFNPVGPRKPAFVALPHGTDVTGLACPTAAECVVLTIDGRKAAFDPARPPASLSPVGLGRATAIAHS